MGDRTPCPRKRAEEAEAERDYQARRGMKQLTISRARALGKDMNAKGIVILAFGDDGEFQACSYGRTKQDCGQLGRWLDGLYDAIERGVIVDPFAEGGDDG